MKYFTLVMAGLILAVIGLYYARTTSTVSERNRNSRDLTSPAAIQPAAFTPGELEIEIMHPGSGPAAVNGDRISVHYTGYLADGTKFDSSVDRGAPFVFTLGTGTVIRGWDKGLAGMKIGEKRKLTIPPDLGYGERGTPGGPIPPNAVLVFTVELLDISR